MQRKGDAEFEQQMAMALLATGMASSGPVAPGRALRNLPATKVWTHLHFRSFGALTPDPIFINPCLSRYNLNHNLDPQP